ncbi:MAG TPA: ankyrin repeat domain-containing protein, partial [Kiloniellaceae bacterium]|nr:ankyrin repeat domain-containing protein [Kiloniellaceae bacterium]
GTLAEVQALAPTTDPNARDRFGLTPFLLACDVGDVEKAKVLLPLCDRDGLYWSKDRTPAMTIAARKARLDMIRWLAGKGFDVDEADGYGNTALIAAAEYDRAAAVELLLCLGADVNARYALSAAVRDRGMDPESEALLANAPDFFETAASCTRSAAVARLLIDAGVAPQDFDNEVLNEVTGASLIPQQRITPAIYAAQQQRRFGNANPEAVENAFWLEMVRRGVSGHEGHCLFGEGERDCSAPAVWCFQRFGMSTTKLADGRWLQIAGEHEDFYDPDFCIYNDVVLHDGKGGVQIYAYPKEIFPPTDFHSATLIENAVILIGNLGYPEDRRPGTTQVLRLDLADFAVQQVETTGNAPGWLSRHRARRQGDSVMVWGGETWDGQDYHPLDGGYELDLKTGVWRKLPSA